MASDSLAIRQASAQRVIRRESVEDPPLLGCMVVVVVQTDARVHTPGAGEGDEVPHLILLGFFQRVHIDRRSRREQLREPCFARTENYFAPIHGHGPHGKTHRSRGDTPWEAQTAQKTHRWIQGAEVPGGVKGGYGSKPG